MKTLFCKEDRYLDNIQSINLESVTVEEPKYSLSLSGRTFSVLEELPEESEVLGYCEVASKEGKKVKSKKNKVHYLVDFKAPVRYKKEMMDEEIGYVKVEGFDNGYIVLVKKNKIIPIIFWLSAILLVGVLVFKGAEPLIENFKETVQDVVDHSSDKGKGEFEIEKYEFENQPVFRMKLNSTPVIQDGKIKIKLQSPEEENKNLKFVTEIYLLSEVADVVGKEIIETYEEPILIYTSPEIYANENVEWGTLDEEVEPGRYIGRARYYVYDLDGNLLGRTSCLLSILAE